MDHYSRTAFCHLIHYCATIHSFDPSTAGDTTYVPQRPMVLGPGGTIYVPQKQLWIIALLGHYSIVSHVFSWAAQFSNTVDTMVKNEDS